VVDFCPVLEPRPQRPGSAIAPNKFDPGAAADKKADMNPLDRIMDILRLLAVSQEFQSLLIRFKGTADQANMMEVGSVKHGC
jgi:hypothetical protein